MPGKLNPKDNRINQYLKYSGIAFQMAFIVLAGILIGKKADRYFSLEKPYITMVLVLLFFGGYMYKLYVDLIKPK